jgi:hypothetical protein
MDLDFDFNKEALEHKLSAFHDHNYFKALLANLNTLRQNKQLCDVEIEVIDKLGS